MAKPIEATPVLCGEDARRLLDSLDLGASPAEMERRNARAHAILQQYREERGIFARHRQRA